MSQTTSPRPGTRSRRTGARGRRPRALAALTLAAGLLLTGTACSGDDDASSGKPEAGAEGGADFAEVEAVVAVMKVCELVDLEPLEKTLKVVSPLSPMENISKGVGLDPAGPQCSGTYNLPAKGVGDLNISVSAYGTQSSADFSYDTRVEQEMRLDQARSEKLTGGRWDRGALFTAKVPNDAFYALAQKGNYVVKIDLKVRDPWGSDADTAPFPTVPEVKAEVRTLMVKDLFPSVEKAVAAG